MFFSLVEVFLTILTDFSATLTPNYGREKVDKEITAAWDDFARLVIKNNLATFSFIALKNHGAKVMSLRSNFSPEVSKELYASFY